MLKNVGICAGLDNQFDNGRSNRGRLIRRRRNGEDGIYFTPFNWEGYGSFVRLVFLVGIDSSRTPRNARIQACMPYQFAFYWGLLSLLDSRRWFPISINLPLNAIIFCPEISRHTCMGGWLLLFVQTYPERTLVLKSKFFVLKYREIW